MDKTHYYRMKIPLYEVDLGGGVYHGNYYHLFELARSEFFNAIDFSYIELMNLGNHLAVAEARCIYRKALHYNQEIEIRTRVDKISSRSLSFYQTIWGVNDKKIKTELYLYLVCINNKGRSATLPKAFKNVLSAWIKG